MSAGPVVVVCSADERYAIPLAAMLRSAMENTAASAEVHVIDCGITPGSRAKIEASLAGGRFRLHWIPADRPPDSELPSWGRVGTASYVKLRLADWLPISTPRALWLDAEMIVLGDLGRLWAAPVENRPLCAVQDLVVPYVSSRFGVKHYRELGLPATAKYFNAGVMVVNLDWWRRHRLPAKVIEYLSAHRQSIFFHDQEGLNVVTCGQWGELDPRWNQIATVAGRRFYRCRHLSAEQYRAVVDDPWIIHYAGTLKPWVITRETALRELYFRYVDRTAWTGWRPRRTLRTAAMGFYDGVLRDWLYPLETRLWKHRPMIG